jgi:hypothetical protein
MATKNDKIIQKLTDRIVEQLGGTILHHTIMDTILRFGMK